MVQQQANKKKALIQKKSYQAKFLTFMNLGKL